MAIAAASNPNSFSGGFRAGFPPTSIGMPQVEDPTVKFGLGKIAGGVTGVGAGGIIAGAGYVLKNGVSAGEASSLAGIARKAAGWGLMVPGGIIGAMGGLAIVSGGFDVLGALGAVPAA